tara:strand:- start:12176 stop:12322 length:147 start_codon:yes stop_codon:yes gene_type:complete
MEDNKIVAEVIGLKPHTLDEMVKVNPFGEDFIYSLKEVENLINLELKD